MLVLGQLRHIGWLFGGAEHRDDELLSLLWYTSKNDVDLLDTRMPLFITIIHSVCQNTEKDLKGNFFNFISFPTYNFSV